MRFNILSKAVFFTVICASSSLAHRRGLAKRFPLILVDERDIILGNGDETHVENFVTDDGKGSGRKVVTVDPTSHSVASDYSFTTENVRNNIGDFGLKGSLNLRIGNEDTSRNTPQITAPHPKVDSEEEEAPLKMKKSQSKHHSSSNSAGTGGFQGQDDSGYYIITGRSSANEGPFQPGTFRWSGKNSKSKIRTSSHVALQAPISRPADPNVCNERFPFQSQTLAENTKDQDRFTVEFDGKLDDISQRMLDLQNEERKHYGLVPFKWNNELANFAGCWSDLKEYGHSRNHFIYSGENIAEGVGDNCYKTPTEAAENAINAFLDEDRDYRGSYSENAGHWSQIVWRDTQYVGCAWAARDGFMGMSEGMTSFYVTCNYYPPGNVEGMFDKQVLKPTAPSELRSSCSRNEKHGG